MAEPTMIEPRFLATAFHHSTLSRRQVWEIHEAQMQFVRRREPAPPCGEIAVERGLLTERQRDRVLNDIEVLKLTTPLVYDPLSSAPRGLLKRGLVTRKNVLIGIAGLLSLVLIYIWTGSWNSTGVAASIFSFLWVVSQVMRPSLFEGSLAWNRYIRYVVYLACPASFLFCGVVLATSIITITPAWSHAPPVLPVLFTIAFIFAGLSALCALVNGIWRHREIWWLENRIDLMAATVSATHLAVCTPRPTVRQELLTTIMRRTALVVGMNPWDRLLNRLAVKGAPFGAVSIWYLEPHSNNSNLVIVKFVAPNAPEDVLLAMEEIKARHGPVILKEKEYEEARRECSVNGRLQRDKFLALKNRNRFISVSGFVYARGQKLDSADARQCLAFDHSYLRAVTGANLTATVKRWLDFRSFVAQPVYGRENNSGTPRGVLILFKNVRNGITGEDRQAMIAAARLLGMGMDSGEM